MVIESNKNLDLLINISKKSLRNFLIITISLIVFGLTSILAGIFIEPLQTVGIQKTYTTVFGFFAASLSGFPLKEYISYKNKIEKLVYIQKNYKKFKQEDQDIDKKINAAIVDSALGD